MGNLTCGQCGGSVSTTDDACPDCGVAFYIIGPAKAKEFLDDSCEVDVPEKIDGVQVIGIGDKAFEKTRLTSITIPAGVTCIGSYAFRKCDGLASVTFEPESKLTSIGDWAFYACKRLTSIAIPDSVTSVGEYAFTGSGLISATLPRGATFSAYSKCTELKSVTIANGVTSIGRDTFIGCEALSSITIPDSVIRIERGAFGSCDRLKSITIPASVTSIANNAFSECYRLTDVTFLGNAPEVEDPDDSFFCATDTTIYRKTEAKGWGDTWCGRPVKLISEKT